MAVVRVTQSLCRILCSVWLGCEAVLTATAASLSAEALPARMEGDSTATSMPALFDQWDQTQTRPTPQDIDTVRLAEVDTPTVDLTPKPWELTGDPYIDNFNPVPRKALWMAALFPGGGQIYNRKYWKLPIIYGGFLGLVYGYNWNQRYYRTYQNAYRDLMTDSPNASYLQFLPGKTTEAKQTYATSRRSYLESTFKRKKNVYRNYRDYCIVGMIGVYLVSLVDAYVDAALFHFDVSSDLSATESPAVTVSYTMQF